MPNFIPFQTDGWFQQKRTETIQLVVGETEAPLPEDEETVCEITMSQNVATTPDKAFFIRDSIHWQFRVTLAGAGLDLDGYAITFTIRSSIRDQDVLVQKRNALAGGGSSEIDMTEPDEGRFIVNIDPADTEDLDGDLNYYYDIQIVKAGEVITPRRGIVRFYQDITV